MTEPNNAMSVSRERTAWAASGYLMLAVFVACVLWPFRRGNRERNDAAAQMIFKDDDDGE